MKQASYVPEQISATQTRRVDIYANIHKALRMFMCDTLNLVGRMDGNDASEVANGLSQMRTLIAICRGHLQHENEFIHSAMEARRPGSSLAISEDHAHHEWALSRLDMLGTAVEQSNGAARDAAIVQLYRHLALFVAENLTHMNAEETENNTVLWETYSDAEIVGIEQAIVASVAPEESAVVMRWMMLALNASERAEKLSAIRQHAPAPVFDAILGIAQSSLSEHDWCKLADTLGVSTRMAA